MRSALSADHDPRTQRDGATDRGAARGQRAYSCTHIYIYMGRMIYENHYKFFTPLRIHKFGLLLLRTSSAIYRHMIILPLPEHHRRTSRVLIFNTVSELYSTAVGFEPSTSTYRSPYTSVRTVHGYVC